MDRLASPQSVACVWGQRSLFSPHFFLASSSSHRAFEQSKVIGASPSHVSRSVVLVAEATALNP
jgi:hypothetical protein